jgi:ATP-dependent Clp protease ATP-binding subunit ClpA
VFERFTDRARRVVVLAQEEARLLNHNYIGTEHLLLGLIHEGEGVAAMALGQLNLSLDAVRVRVEEAIGEGQAPPMGHIPFTPRAKKVLELSLREAQQLHHNYIGTEHILLGLIREGEGVAAQVLQELGADLSRVRQQVVQLLSGATAFGEVTAEVVGGESQPVQPRTGAWRVEGIEPMGYLRRGEGEPEREPTCPRCEADLTQSARYRIQEIAFGAVSGEPAAAHIEGTPRASILYCAECGRIIAANLLDPGDDDRGSG